MELEKGGFDPIKSKKGDKASTNVLVLEKRINGKQHFTSSLTVSHSQVKDSFVCFYDENEVQILPA